MKKTVVLWFGCVWAACAVEARPVVVGLVDSCPTNNLVSAGTPYADSVLAAGAIPFVLPATTNAAVMEALLDRVDMLVFQGGEDVEPSRYGEKPSPNLGRVNLRRDAWELEMLGRAKRRKMPVLGICRGCQLLNVGFGGTLWQDVPSEKPGAAVHRIDGEHDLAVVAGSHLARLLDGKVLSVNSIHHQAVKKPASGFRVTATSPDGVVEAIECGDYPAMGVQFHPEKMFAATGRSDFLPLFRGSFAGLKEASARPAKRMRLVAIPDYCATNGCAVAKPNMAAALELAGFASVVIPFTPDDAVLEAALADADALMVAGGLGLLQAYEKRCTFERRAIRLALKRGIPIAGVCHGSQVINAYFGGTLEGTPQCQGEKNFLIAHRMPVRKPYTDNFHLADLTPGSRIARVLGSTRAVINSSHNRRSFEIGKGLKVTARAPDGVVEAIEHESLPVMAFQFHPERMTFDRRFVELLRESLSPVGNPTDGAGADVL